MINKIVTTNSPKEQQFRLPSEQREGDLNSFERFEKQMVGLEDKRLEQVKAEHATMNEAIEEGSMESFQRAQEGMLEIKRLGSNIDLMNNITLKAHKMNEYLCDIIKNSRF